MDTTPLTYAELADRLGIEREAARQLVKRRRWLKYKGNDGQVRVSVPVDDLSPPGPRPVEASGSDPVADRSMTGLSPVLDRHIERLEKQLEDALRKADERDGLVNLRDVLTSQVEALRAALAAAEQDRDRWHQVATTPAPQPLPWWRRLVG